MGFSEELTTRFHQTRLSGFVKRAPGISAVAQRWWIREQTKYFREALSTLGPPLDSAPTEAGSSQVLIPSLTDARNKLPEYVAAGEAFSDAMSEWCSTSKFISISREPESLGYQDVYAPILSHLTDCGARVLEIGIGVNDPHARSGMSYDHQPGASLRGWSYYLKGSEVHGADIDRRVLVDTDRYTTHYVDQLDVPSIRALAQEVGAPLDLIVDDGLHTPEANANVMTVLLPSLSPIGVMVVEDILPEYDPIWESLGGLLPSAYRCDFFPSRVLRQYRETGGGIAVITRSI